jgi:AraC-like DNA-binding protein
LVIAIEQFNYQITKSPNYQMHVSPGFPLGLFIETIWVYHNDPAPHTLERVLPTGAMQLIVNLKEDQTRLYDSAHPEQCLTTAGTVLAGVRSSYQLIDTSEQEFVAGLAFKPGGVKPFVRVPAHETRDTDIPVEVLWGSCLTAELRERLLEAPTLAAKLDVLEAVLQEMLTPRSMHPAVAFSLRKFNRVPLLTSIAAVTDAVGMSAKRFIEHFIRRFQQAVTLAHSGGRIDWATVALDCGYFDQAHVIHDFRAFSGITPADYVAARTPHQNHVKFLQSAETDL